MPTGPARVAQLMRSTPIRQALLLVAAVAVVNLLTLGGAWLKMRGDLVQSIRSDLSRELASFDVSATPGALATLVTARAGVTDPAETVYVFLGADGRQAGNARASLDRDTVQINALAPTRPISDQGYVHEMRRLSGGILIVAQSLEPIARLSDTFASLLAFSLLPTLAISLALGALIARRSARRVEQIEATLNRIAAGDLAARCPPAPGLDDDLARIGSGINRMAGKQQAATESLRQVSTDIAHDLRTPLQRISLMLDKLRTELPDTGPAADLADRAAEESARAVAVFGSLLQISQIEGGRPAARFARFDLRDPVRQIAELYTPTAEDRGDRLDLLLPPGPVPVDGDAGLIGQALANLLENALRHAPPGGRITVSVESGLAGPTVSIADTGPGIPTGEREKVLRRLYRLEQSRTTPGNGLGLALVNAIAALHSARLSLEDAAPGLRVTLTFPAPGAATNPGPV